MKKTNFQNEFFRYLLVLVLVVSVWGCSDEDDDDDEGTIECYSDHLALSVDKDAVEPVQQVEVVDPSLVGTDEFNLVPVEIDPSLVRRMSPSVTSNEDRVLVFGGCDIDENGQCAALKSTGAIYDIQTKTWKSMSTENAPTPRIGHAAVINDGYLYIWGGCVRATYQNSKLHCDERSTSTSRYRLDTDTWEEGPKTSGSTNYSVRPKMSSEALSVDETLYFAIVGGETHKANEFFSLNTVDFLADAPFVLGKENNPLGMYFSNGRTLVSQRSENRGLVVATSGGSLAVRDHLFTEIVNFTDVEYLDRVDFEFELMGRPVLGAGKVLMFGNATRSFVSKIEGGDETTTIVGSGTKVSQSATEVAFLHNALDNELSIFQTKGCELLVQEHSSESGYGVFIGSNAMYFFGDQLVFFDESLKSCSSFSIDDSIEEIVPDVVAGVADGVFLWRTGKLTFKDSDEYYTFPDDEYSDQSDRDCSDVYEDSQLLPEATEVGCDQEGVSYQKSDSPCGYELVDMAEKKEPPEGGAIDVPSEESLSDAINSHAWLIIR